MVSMLTRKLLRDLWGAKAQIITIAAVVASGMAAFCAALSTYESLGRMQAHYYEKARFAHVFAAARRAPQALAGRFLEIAGVVDADTTLSFDAQLDRPGVVEPMVARLIALPKGGDGSGLRMNRLTLMQGRWLDVGSAHEVLVSQSFAKARGIELGAQLGVLINGKRERLTVVGVVLSPEYIFSIQPGGGDEKSFGVFWMSHERLAAAFNMEGAFNRVMLRLSRGASEAAVIDALDRLLEPYGATGAFGRSEQLSHRAITQEINELRVFGLVLPSVFLGVAVFLLGVVLGRQISTQRGQIAVLKALGCPDVRIGLHYLLFVMVIVWLGLMGGLAAGLWLGQLLTGLYTQYFHFPVADFQLRPYIAWMGAAASILAALMAVWRALVKVVRLPPAEAMQPARPGNFRATVLERLGLGAWLAPAVRLVLRDIERRPSRAVLTTVGIACAVAILISGTWWRDAIHHLIEVEIPSRERQDVSLALVEPASRSAIYDVWHLPGVLRAEGVRSAPVRLSHGHRTERTELTGLPSDGTLRQLLGPQGDPMAVPDQGVVLSHLLARRLDAAPGDWVRIEFLQGERRVHTLPVAALAYESMGLSAYMQRDALNRLLGEGDRLSGARVRLDAAHREAFLEHIKQTPRVAFAVELGPLLRTFRETSARNILVFTSVLSVLAGIIALGVVYNNARIALAERQWELASLRVLGFTRAQVSALLLGELGLELALALPLGWALGYALSWAMLQAITPETFEIPFIISPATYAWASVVILLAALISAWIVRRRVDRLDLVSALKVRE